MIGTRDEKQSHDGFEWSVLDALKAHVAVLDKDGLIIGTNEAWRAFARANNLAGPADCIGMDYLGVSLDSCRAGDLDACAAAEGVRAVLDGERAEFAQVIACHSPTEQRWFTMRVAPLSAPGRGRAVVTMENVSSLKLTEQDLRRSHASAEASALASRESEQIIRTITDAIPGLVSYWDSNVRCRFANKPYLDWFGRRAEDVIGKAAQDILGPRLFALSQPHILDVLAGKRQHFERTRTTADGRDAYSWVTYIPDTGSDGGTIGFFVLITDVTPLKEAETRALELSERLMLATRAGGIGIWSYDLISKELAWDEQVYRLYGISSDSKEPVSQLWRQAFLPADWQKIREDFDAALNGERELETDFNIRLPSGEMRCLHAAGTVQRNSAGDPVKMIGVSRDITETRRYEEALAAANRRLEALSLRDPLTGLANRRHLDDGLETEWRRGLRQNQPLSLLMVDVDNFKPYNDRYGHPGGDECLRQVAVILTKYAQRAGELAARYGGEEFALVLPGSDCDSALAAAEALRQSVSELALVHELSEAGVVTVSIGVASTIPNADQSVSDLIAAADRALYQAKEGGRNKVVLAPPYQR